MRYENFVIQITTGGRDEIVLRVSESSVGESRAVIAGPKSQLGRLLEQSRAAWSELDELMEEDGPERIGQLLYDALFLGPIQGRFLEAVGRANSRNAEGIRIKLQVDFESPILAEAHSLPWEYLYRSEAGSFLSLDRRFAVVRHLRLPVSRSAPSAPGRLKLLVAVAVPRDCQPLDTEEECRRITATWQGDTRMEIRFLAHATLDRLRESLLADEYHGFHFIGHGCLDPTNGDGLLLFEDDNGGSAECTGRDLAIQLADRTSLRWVFLNACSTGSSSTQRPFGGLATALLRTGIPAVLAMQRPVGDRAAVLFSHTVYQRLAAGEGIDTAVSEGRLTIHRNLPGSPEWGTPVLFLRSVDGELFHRVPLPSHEPEPTLPDPGISNVKPRTRWRVFGAMIFLAGLITLGTASYLESRRPQLGLSETSAESQSWESVAVREGEVISVPAFGAQVSVAFKSDLGAPFAHLTVSLAGRNKAFHKTFMGPTTMSLGEGKNLSIQSIDWSARQIWILPVRSEGGSL